MIMASDTVQLGKLTIITELGCIIGSGQEAQIRIQEDHVQPRRGSHLMRYPIYKIISVLNTYCCDKDLPDPILRHVVIQHRTVPSLEPNPETYFEVQFHAFGQLNGQLKPAEVIEK